MVKGIIFNGDKYVLLLCCSVGVYRGLSIQAQNFCRQPAAWFYSDDGICLYVFCKIKRPY